MNSGGCTIIRTYTVTHSKMNLVTGEITQGASETITGPCNIPLFGKRTGVCDACAKGWTHPQNTFANDEERAKATASKESEQ